MKPLRLSSPLRHFPVFIAVVLSLLLPTLLRASPATVLFEDDFTGGIPGWTAVQPAGVAYTDGPMLWQFDKVSNAFSEQSNIYTGPATPGSTTRIAVMLINDTVAPADFTYTARLTAGDDDGFGLIFGYLNETNFYRVTFARQGRTSGWPYQGWGVEQMTNGQPVDLFGGPSQPLPWVNTASQPFDVTITVSAGKLTLKVVDDPLVFASVYDLVTDQPLPSSAAGKVGMFNWGMAGGTPRSFQVQNPVLSPTALAGNPAGTILTNWSFLITPRADGSTNMNSAAPPLWSYGVDINGDRGTMIENSDTYLNADNNANGTTNFAAPSAVAGDVNWSNYVYTARFISSDDDGYGMLLRFKNETNFYRIGFRAQNSMSGVRHGISVQKNVNLEFDEIFSDSTFTPPVGTAMDVHAAINTNRLQVMVIVNPLGTSPQASLFGPFDITGNTVDSGKVGIFSWAQLNGGGVTSDAGTEVDFVKVRQVSGEGLFVISPYGTPNPPVGLNDLPPGTTTASVDSPVVTAPGIRQVSTGWSGLGSVPASGTANTVTFNLASLSSVTWNWATEYLLSTDSSFGGTVTTSLGPWVPAGSNVTVTAVPNQGFMFVGWSGDNASTNASLALVMNRPAMFNATFTEDSDADGLPDSWELAYFGDLSQTPQGDYDGDGVPNLTEYRRGTDPKKAEALIASDGLSSQWVNTQRDPALPGMLRVVDFGSGFRGAFDDSNDNRFGNDTNFISAADIADYASFQSPRVVVKSNLWNDNWSTNFSATAEFSVGDNDGNCFYFRYKDEQNWYRITLCGEDAPSNLARPLIGLSVQSRVNGQYALIQHLDVSGPLSSAYTDPLDGSGTPAGYKRVRLTVNATNENFEARVVPWNAQLSTPGFDPSLEYIVMFTDASHAAGRIGFGFWGQDGFGNNLNQTNGNPIPYGAFIDNIALKAPADGAVVFSENWGSASLSNAFPVGWSNPFTGTPGLEGNWWVTAHGTLAQQSDDGLPTTGTLSAPAANADGPILLAPDQGSANYFLELGIHAFDNDGVGFVYNFQDTNNYSRVLFRRESTFTGDVPPGLTVSHKFLGIWSDVVRADASFLYTPGSPFALQFANNNGRYSLVAQELDNPANTFTWQWSGMPAAPENRFGLATWRSTDAHFLYARAYALSPLTPVEFLKITGVAVSGGNIVLTIDRPQGWTYDVLRAAAVGGEYTPVATGQSTSQYSEPLPAQTTFYRLRRSP